MINLLHIHRRIIFCILLLSSFETYSTERSIEASIDARTEYNDNIFLTHQAHDSITGLIVTPALSGVMKEEHWETELRARVRISRYSDQNINGNDQLFDLTGRYLAERHIFSLNLAHNLDSNLNAASSDFGVIGRRVNRKTQSLTPQYTYLVSERSALVFSYTYSDVDYLDAENTGFTPYITESGSGSFIYNLSERSKISISLNVVDYTSKNDLVKYQLFMSRFGIEHKFSETLSTDFLIGVSRRNSTNLQIQTFDFFGLPITTTQEIDFSDRGLVLDAGILKQLETGQIEARLSRDNTTNSFGGLDEVNKIKISYTKRLSELWRYKLSGWYDDITSISTGSRVTDRDTFFFEAITYYSINKNWNVNASYRYITRKFKSDISEDRAPHSNRIYLGLTYNFPTLLTF